MCEPGYLCLDYILISVTILFATTAAWEDLRPFIPYLIGKVSYEQAVHGRIPNKLLVLWLATITLLITTWPLWKLAGIEFAAWKVIPQNEGLPYPVAVLVNTGIAFVIAFVLWNANMWVAGDAKMFVVLAYSLPLSTYYKHYTPYFPSFALFFNTFVSVLLLLLVEMLASTIAKLKHWKLTGLVQWVKKSLKKGKENRRMIINLVLFFLAIFTTIRILRYFAREWIEALGHIDKTIVYVILFLMFHPLLHFAQNRYAFLGSTIIVAAYLIYAFFFDKTGTAKYELIHIGTLTGSVIVFRIVYDAYLAATDEIQIPYQELRPRMVLSKESIRKFKERKQFYKEKLAPILADGLTAQQVDAIKDWYKENQPEGMVGVSRTFPFAPALLMGTIITILCGGVMTVI